MEFSHIFSYLGEYLFPGYCALCGSALTGLVEAASGLCDECLRGLEDPASAGEACCARCGRPLISEFEVCLPCRNGGEKALDAAAVVYPYSGKYRQLLAAYKYGKSLSLGRFFVEKIVRALERLPLDGKNPVLVPVPPRPGKLRKTGWDQVEYLAVLLERARMRNPEIPSVCRCLKRLPSGSQKQLDREARKSNLKGKIIAVRKVPQTAIVFDDVMTTGSTLEACAGALKLPCGPHGSREGSQTVYGVSLFYD
jgi:ComF family protein